MFTVEQKLTSCALMRCRDLEALLLRLKILRALTDFSRMLGLLPAEVSRREVEELVEGEVLLLTLRARSDDSVVDRTARMLVRWA